VGPFTLFRLPLLPLTGLIRLAEVLRDEAERKLHDPAAVQRQLEEIAEARATGRLSEEEAARAEQEAIGRLINRP
jgi:hypothetical protein